MRALIARISEVLTQVAWCSPSGSPAHELETQAQRQVKLCAATIYEAEISAARNLSSLQKQRALQTSARTYAAASWNSAPSEWLHAALLQVTVKAACGTAKKKHLVAKKPES